MSHLQTMSKIGVAPGEALQHRCSAGQQAHAGRKHEHRVTLELRQDEWRDRVPGVRVVG